MYKRKKKPIKARVSHTRRKAKRAVKQTVKRRKPMAKKKSTWDETPANDEDQSDEFETAEGSEQTTDQHNEGEKGQTGEEGEVPVPTETAASDDGVYVVDSVEIAIKGTVHKRGDKVTLTPEELEQVQASGVRILPVE
jgi:hypothetical protein